MKSSRAKRGDLIILLSLHAAFSVSLGAPISFSGNLNPSNLYRISNGTEISLPFRLAESDAVYTWRSLDFRVSMAWEARWSKSFRKSRVDVREAYLSFYPRFGEIKLGKQIHAWGAVDGNNPTDNLSAYDYYYLFLPGTDRKIGSLSLSVTAYVGSWKLQGVFIPDHEPNRLPFNEPDFPISVPPKPGPSLVAELPDSMEYGLRVSHSFRAADISVSYLRGRDRVFVPVGTQVRTEPFLAIVPRFGYRKTTMLGADFVTFLGRLSLRGEAAYYRTENDHDAGQFHTKFETDASYLQYVLEVEYPGPWEVNLMGQVIGQTVVSAEGTTLDLMTGPPAPLDRENFQAGMGTPFALFVDRAVLVAVDGLLMDRRLELSMMALVNLEEAGTMAGVSVEYSPVENWDLEGGVTLLRGDEENIFKDLEDFSHVRMGLKYSF